jgi:hypothetical protein
MARVVVSIARHSLLSWSICSLASFEAIDDETHPLCHGMSQLKK